MIFGMVLDRSKPVRRGHLGPGRDGQALPLSDGLSGSGARTAVPATQLRGPRPTDGVTYGHL